MTKKCIISVLLVVAWALFASLFYKTIMLMLLFLVWKKHIFEMLPGMDTEMGNETLLDALLRMPVDGNAPLSHRLK